MLNIITIASRFENLYKLWESIPQLENIIWHIAISKERKDFEYQSFMEKAKVYELNCKDNDTSYKINSVFEEIEQGYVCFLDDDTIWFPNMYTVYEKYIDSKIGLIIGQQVDRENNIRLQATLPYECAIDIGNTLFHSECLKTIKWGDFHFSDKIHADFEFLDRVYKHYGIKYTDLLQEPISYYNYLSDKEDTLDYKRN